MKMLLYNGVISFDPLGNITSELDEFLECHNAKFHRKDDNRKFVFESHGVNSSLIGRIMVDEQIQPGGEILYEISSELRNNDGYLVMEFISRQKGSYEAENYFLGIMCGLFPPYLDGKGCNKIQHEIFQKYKIWCE